MTRAMLSEPGACWIVVEGLAGTQAQCEAVAAALGVEPEVKRVGLRAPWRWPPKARRKR